jgi:hypothetical protein
MNSPLGRFAEDVKIVPILSYVSANSDRSSEVIDTAGFGRCCIVVHLAAIATGGANSIYLAHSDVADNETTLNTGANVANTNQVIADDDDNQVKYIDFEPSKRYYQLNVNKDATNAMAESAVAYLYHSKDRPVTHAGGTSTVGDGAALAEGEAFGRVASGTI